MKKRLPPILILLFLCLGAFAQSDTLSFKEDIIISLGYGIHSNSFNRNYYSEFKDQDYNHLDNLQTVTLKMSFPTSQKNINFFVGTLLEKDLSDDSSSGFTPGRTNSTKQSLLGGGVFAGISPIWKSKNFGFTSEFSLGAFSYKETYAHFNNISEPNVFINEEKNTFGIGGYSSIGFYLKMGFLGINPNVNVVVTGGETGSFIFYGVSLPVTIHL